MELYTQAANVCRANNRQWFIRSCVEMLAGEIGNPEPLTNQHDVWKIVMFCSSANVESVDGGVPSNSLPDILKCSPSFILLVYISTWPLSFSRATDRALNIICWVNFRHVFATCSVCTKKIHGRITCIFTPPRSPVCKDLLFTTFGFQQLCRHKRMDQPLLQVGVSV